MKKVLLITKERKLEKVINSEPIDLERCECIIEGTSKLAEREFDFLIFDADLYVDIFIKYLEQLKNQHKLKLLIYSNKYNLEHKCYSNSHYLDGYITSHELITFSEVLKIVGMGIKFISATVLMNQENYILATLTLREREVTELLVKNKTNIEIADSLSLSESTIKTHIYNIYKKLGVKKRQELVALF